MELSEARREINAINEEMRSLFLRRMALSGEIAAYKKEHGLPILDQARENAILDAMADGTGDYAPYVRRYFEAVMALSRDFQKEKLAKRPNIVLVGMPGAGKSAVGEALSVLSGREAIETDEEIVKRSGKSIPEIFKEDGEAAFRTLEKEVIKALSAREGIILITGGGAVKNEENRRLFSSCGRVYRIDRPVELLAREGRPLSENADLEKMLAEREPFYQAASDVTIKNDRSPEEAAVAIWNDFNAFFAG